MRERLVLVHVKHPIKISMFTVCLSCEIQKKILIRQDRDNKNCLRIKLFRWLESKLFEEKLTSKIIF